MVYLSGPIFFIDQIIVIFSKTRPAPFIIFLSATVTKNYQKFDLGKTRKTQTLTEICNFDILELPGMLKIL